MWDKVDFEVFLREVDRWSGLSDDNNSIYHTHIKIRPIQIIGNWKGNKVPSHVGSATASCDLIMGGCLLEAYWTFSTYWPARSTFTQRDGPINELSPPRWRIPAGCPVSSISGRLATGGGDLRPPIASSINLK
ncbi:hypothetical protein Fcan01_07076 [Folsomia candida]|uniref:Uncharacterized protein n=1 Tax=Folsomia candida TaxID=158441 RepID=A0A226EJU6_FOLCA|nr:hypothetical protein Fcan01_07076 [Folsomia candida]